MTYKVEMKQMLEEGEDSVILNGFSEWIEYAIELTNLKRISKGVYITE